MLLNAVIIEDERNGLINLKHLLAEHCEDVEVIGEADGVESGLKLFKREEIKPDIAFLDINLQDGKVFQLLNQLENIDFDVIFVICRSCSSTPAIRILSRKCPSLLLMAYTL